ncbi:MAG: hypothetical protein M1828_005922 [Chrysothrix sp. TS-e1954]|nr:MAG: hypothetical protein M1828_005922 [Chrysothrix sp. TS-e1954]
MAQHEGHASLAGQIQASRPHTGAKSSLSNLTPNSLYILLTVESLDERDKFHWAIYLHLDESIGGDKYHIRNLGGHWITDHSRTRSIAKTNFLVGLVCIASVSQKDVEQIESIITAEEGVLNQTPGLTCRMYCLRACERLAKGAMIAYTSLSSLEREILDFGNLHNADAEQNLHPRPIMVSRMVVPDRASSQSQAAGK